MLSLDNVTFGYPSSPALFDGVSLEIEAGSYVLVSGPSGAGKSTLLRLLCRLEEPQTGTICFRGADIREIHPAELRRKVAYVQQTPTVVDGSVHENLLLPFSFKANAALERPSDTELRERMCALRLDSIPLDRNAKDLSVGEAQRLCLIRTLLLQPQALLMDEPTSALDAESAQVVHETTRGLHQDGKTIVVISHAEADREGITGILEVKGGEVRAA